MTVYGGSHTSFDAGAFGAGAVGGALTVAGAMVAGARHVAAQNAANWDAWDRDQLVQAVELEHDLRVNSQRRADRLESDNDRLRAVIATLTAPRSSRAR
jgi:hypothetical protein